MKAKEWTNYIIDKVRDQRNGKANADQENFFQIMMSKEPFYNEDDDYIDCDSLCLLILLYSFYDNPKYDERLALKANTLFDLVKDDDGLISDEESLRDIIGKVYKICCKNMIEHYYDALRAKSHM